jgi:hypothetical protein
MPGDVPGNFGLKKRPATLDLSGIITKVNWLLGFRYLKITIREQFNFGSPSIMGFYDFPPGKNFKYNFDPLTIKHKRPDVKENPSIDPITIDTINAYYSWGDAVRSNNPDAGSFAEANLYVGILATDDDWEFEVKLHGNLPALPDQPGTWYDIIVTREYFFFDGTKGGGQSLVEHITREQLDEIIANLSGSNEVASWTGSVEIIRTYQDTPSGGRRHSLTRSMRAEAKRLSKNKDGSTKTEAITIEGVTNDFGSSSSDAPLSTKIFLVQYTAKPLKLKITAK